MFAQFIVPFDFDTHSNSYTWVVHRAVQNFKSDLMLFCDPEYWMDADSVIKAVGNSPNDGAYEYLTSRDVQSHDFEAVDKFIIQKSKMTEILKLKSRSEALHIIEDGRLDYIEDCTLKLLDDTAKIDAFLLWQNCRSISSIAQSRKVPVIFNELGPLRPPNYHLSIYFDFQGLHGNSQAPARWSDFCHDSRCKSLPILSREHLRRMLSVEDTPKSGDHKNITGIALQASTGGLVSYSNKFTNYCLIHFAMKKFQSGFLIRHHPGSPEIYEDFVSNYDDSPDSTSFLNKVDETITISSGIAFESILMGKPTYMLGNSPIKMGAWDIETRSPKMNEEDQLRWLNWFIFAYLAPYSYLFCKDYYNWRLSMPSEFEVYSKNFEWWSENVGI